MDSLHMSYSWYNASREYGNHSGCFSFFCFFCSKLAEFSLVAFISVGKHCAVLFTLGFSSLLRNNVCKKTLFLAASFRRTRNKRNLFFC